MNKTTDFFGKGKNKLPIIKQIQMAECGHACVAMIAGFHGHTMDLYALRQRQEPSMQGVTMLDLVRMLEGLSLNARALRVEVDCLKQVQCPAVLHWNMNHFVVLKEVKANGVIIHDPAVGRRNVSFQEVAASFTGIVLEVEKSEDFTLVQASNTLRMRDLFHRVHGLKNNILILFMLSLAIEVLVLINPLFLQYITDAVSNSNTINNVYVIVLGFFIASVCHGLIEYTRARFVVYLTNQLSEYFSSGVMNHLLRLPLDYFERRHKGDILSRFHAMHEIQNKMAGDTINTLLDGIILICVLIILSMYSMLLTGLVVLSLAGFLSLRIFSYQHLKHQTELSVSGHAAVSSKFLEIIQNILPIKLYAKESVLYSDWKNYFIKAMNADTRIAHANIAYQTTSLFLSSSEYILVVAIAAGLVTTHQFSVGMLVAFLAYRQILVSKAGSFIHKLFEYRLISVQMDRVADILIQPTELHDERIRIKRPLKGDIAVHEISYQYPGNSACILHAVSFHIHSGEKVVITGPSGIGKTTLLKILLGLIPPSKGRILIDGIALESLGSRHYRTMCASVMQDDSLLSGSVLDNITFMDTRVDMDRVIEAATIAHIHEDIVNMPMGYETLTGDMGSSLSGGQKQRVLIARALYKNPKILFLDEATSHLDEATEIKINNALKKLDITQVVIAHRQETIKMADRVITLV